jgi:fructose-1,6-bisphosphatase/inositol monophosphatase family enzyme
VPGADDVETGAGRSNLKLLGRDGTKTTLLMELREGRNKQIRQMLLRLGHPVRRLRRVGMGSLRLRGLAVGAWRDLTSHELRELKEAAFKPAAQRARRNERGQSKPVAAAKKVVAPVGKPVKPRQSTQSLDIARPKRAGRPPAARPQRGSRSR